MKTEEKGMWAQELEKPWNADRLMQVGSVVGFAAVLAYGITYSVVHENDSVTQAPTVKIPDHNVVLRQSGTITTRGWCVVDPGHQNGTLIEGRQYHDEPSAMKILEVPSSPACLPESTVPDLHKLG